MDGLSEEAARALFQKFGHDNKGRMPIDVFVQRLFAGRSHVLSLHGLRQALG